MSDLARIPLPATVPPTVRRGSPLPREAVCILPDDCALNDTIDELLLAGFARCEVGLLARTEDAANNLGLSVPLETLMDDPAAPRTDWLCPAALQDADIGLMSGFSLIPMFGTIWAATIAGSSIVATTALAAGTGGLGLAAGGAVAWWLHHRYADHVRHQRQAGGLLLWVRTPTAELEGKAVAVMAAHGGRHVHLHGETDEWRVEQ